MPISGHKVQYGVDTISNPALIQGRTLNFDSVNRTYRGGYNDTRPPFQLLNLEFENDADKEYFENASVTGIKGYTAVPPYTRNHLVVTVGTSVFAGQISGNTVIFKKLYTGLDPTLMHQFFVQGRSILIINNGKTDAVFWNGQTDRLYSVADSIYIKNQDPVNKMPIFNISIYAHGRIWGLTEDGRLYAGDHLYSQGIDKSDQVLLSFSESQYPESGDGFTATSEWGDARGLAVIARDPSTNGHGEVIAFYLGGAFSVNPIDDRNKWTDENIQQTIFSGEGEGGCSPWSILPINNDLIFRRSDKRIASLRQTVSQESSTLQDRPFSNEVYNYLNFDLDNLLVLSMSGTEDKRIFFTVNHEVVDNAKYNGKHRFGNGLVVGDLASGTNSSPDQISWDGLWTGPRITGIAQMFVSGQKRSIFSSYDTDGINRLYMLSQFRGDDMVLDGQRKIVSMYSFGNMFDGISVDSNAGLQEYSLNNSTVFYSDSIGKCSISADYRNTYSDNWFTLYENGTIGLDPFEDSIIFDLTNGSWNSDSVKNSVTEWSGKKAISGLVFDARIKLEGTVRIRANLLIADAPQEMQLTRKKQCDEKNSGMADDAYDYFSYQF